MRALVPMEDAQARFQLLRLSATSRLSHLLRTVPPSITCQAAANYDALVEWALASIIAGDGAAAAGLPTPTEAAHDPTVCQNQTYLGHDALRQAHLPIREGGLGLTSSISIKGAAYIGCHALVLGHVVAASGPANLKRRPWTYQQHLHQRRGIHRLPRPGPGACRRCLHPGEPSVPS